MKTQSLFLILIALAASLPVAAQTLPLQNHHVMWYDEPAALWTEALPLGSGRLGAMVFGQPSVEHLQLNEETLWAGRPNNNVNPEALAYLPTIRQLVFEGKNREAQDLCTRHVKSPTNQGMPYQPFGDLRLVFPEHTVYSHYRRALDLDSALSTVSYQVAGIDYKRECFTSLTDSVIVLHLTASEKGKISFTALLTTPQQDSRLTSTPEGDITLHGLTGEHEKCGSRLRYMGRVAVRHEGGILTSEGGVLTLQHADEATLFIAIATAFRNYHDIDGDARSRVATQLAAAKAYDYPTLRARHIAAYQQQANTNTLWLGADEYADKPLVARLEAFKETHDRHLAALYYRFGRYLLISCSQPDGQPANLQGIWNDKMLPSWDSKYTTNINLEMNYWPAEVCNLSSLNEPLFRLIREVSETGKEAARVMYGTVNPEAWVLHHNTDIWRVTGAIDNAPSGMWMSGGAWLCTHLWQHYLYTHDVAFLAEYYPVMRGAAAFFEETMVTDPRTGCLVVCPSNSPENAPRGVGATTQAGCTMDNQLISDLFHQTAAAARILAKADNQRFGSETATADRLESLTAKLPPMKIGKWGQLQEWQEDLDSPDDTHRHVSHLYGLYPSQQISPRTTPALAEAARVSLEHRGDISTGWAMGWRVCLWARLLDGNHAYTLIENQLRLTHEQDKSYESKQGGGTYPNLFDAHPPFQIDGNFGCTAGIAEMLMQSQDPTIVLLPALPDVWRKEGRVTGLVARGGFVIDMEWKDGVVSSLTVTSRLGGTLRLAVPGQKKDLVKQTKAGQRYRLIG